MRGTDSPYTTQRCHIDAIAGTPVPWYVRPVVHCGFVDLVQ